MMHKIDIYVALSFYPWEGAEIEGVFTTEKEAKEKLCLEPFKKQPKNINCKDYRTQSKYEILRIEKHTVDKEIP